MPDRYGWGGVRAVAWGDALGPVPNGTINARVGASYNPSWSQIWLQALALPWGAWVYPGISALSTCAVLYLSGHGDRLVLSSKQGMVSPSCPKPFPCHVPPVALNFQTAGMEMDLCDGLFSQNGRCGYVLKPPFMRDEETLFNPSDPGSREGPGPITLTIQVWDRGETLGSRDSVLGLCQSQMGGDTVGQRAGAEQPPSRLVQLLSGSRGPCPFPQVISGQQLPKVANTKDGAVIDPLVRVEIHGVPADQARQETKYIENNGECHGATRDPAVPRWPIPALPHPPSTHSPFPGFNPRWDETLQFQLHVPELALVRFVVEDYDKTSRNDFVGQFTLAFTNIKPGEWLLPDGGGALGQLQQGCLGLSWVLESGVVGSSQPEPCCPPCRLPPHPSSLQGRHQHPTLFSLCPHPHHRAAWP